MANYIDEYLIGLGFEVKVADLRKFESAIRQARGLVQSETSGMVTQLLKWQVAITSGFASIGLATLGIADKVAQADQSYRLFSERMYMTESAGRSLKRALDELGTTIEEASYDPEINARVKQLAADDQAAQAGFGENFKANLIRIRDLRFEFSRLKLAGEDAVEKLVADLSQHFAPQIDAVISKMREWTNYVLTHLPEISDYIQGKLLPIFNDMWDVLSETGVLLKNLGTDLIHVIGILSGDKALENAPLSFDSIAVSIEKVTHWLALFVHLMIRAETVIAGFGKGALNMGKEIWEGAKGIPGIIGDLFTGKDSDPDYVKRLMAINDLAGEDFKQGWAALPFGNQLKGAAKGAAVEGVMGFGTETTGDPAMDSLLARMARGWASGWKSTPGNPAADTLGTSQPWANTNFLSSRPLGLSQLGAFIAEAEKQTGVPAALIRSLITAESGGRNLPPNSKDAAGIMQLQGATARDLGVDRMDPAQNIMGGTRYLAELLQRYKGNLPQALAAYNWGMGNVDKGKFWPMDVQAYVNRVISGYDRAAGGSGQSNIFTINFNNPSGSPEDLQKMHVMVKTVVKQVTKQQDQRDAAAMPFAY